DTGHTGSREVAAAPYHHDLYVIYIGCGAVGPGQWCRCHGPPNHWMDRNWWNAGGYLPGDLCRSGTVCGDYPPGLWKEKASGTPGSVQNGCLKACVNDWRGLKISIMMKVEIWSDI